MSVQKICSLFYNNPMHFSYSKRYALICFTSVYRKRTLIYKKQTSFFPIIIHSAVYPPESYFIKAIYVPSG